MFLLVLAYVTVYLFLVEKYKPSFLSFLPAFIIYFLVAGLQYNVGTDYMAYFYTFSGDMSLYLKKSEYLFYYLVEFLNYLNLPPQSLFLSISFIQSVLIFYYFKLIKKDNVILWLFFITFFCITNIYNNQLNGIRQYVVVCFVPILTLVLYRKKIGLYIALVFICTLFHSSAVFLIILIPIRIFLRKMYKKSFFIFLIMPGFFIFSTSFIDELITRFLPNYLHYLDTVYSEGVGIESYFTKLYYLPGIIYFYYNYSKVKKHSVKHTYFDFMIVVFSLTYWMFILSTELAIASRIFVYFLFFYTFPFYFLLRKLYIGKKVLMFSLILIYIITPYVLKVTFLARGEYLYNSIVFN